MAQPGGTTRSRVLCVDGRPGGLWPRGQGPVLTVPFRQEDAGPAPVLSFTSSLTGKINVNNFLVTIGVSGASRGDSGTQREPGLGFDAISLTR